MNGLKLDSAGYVAESINNSKYSTPTKETAQVIHLPSNTVNGQFSVTVKGNTRTNLLTENQASIETDTKGFAVVTGGGGGAVTISRDTTEKYFGNASLKVVTDGAIVNQGVKAGNARGMNGKTYKGSVYIKAPDGATMQLLLRRELTTNLAITSFTATGNWQRVDVQFTLDADTEDLGLWVRTDSTAQAITFYVDGLMIEEGTELREFIIGTKSTNRVRLRSVGKNIIDPMRLLRELQKQHPNGSTDVYLTTYNGRPAICVNNPNLLYRKRIFKGCFKPNTQYTSQITVTHVQSDLVYSGVIFRFVYDDGTYSYISYGDNNNNTIEKTIVTSAKGKSILAIECTYGTSTTDTYIYIDDLQLEEGSTATSYEPYKESVVYLDETLRSLPNGVSDEVDVDEGKKIQRVSDEVIIDGSKIGQLVSGTNVDRVGTIPFSDNAKWSDIAINNNINVYGREQTTLVDFDDTSNIGKFFADSYNKVWFVVQKGTYADLASAQSAWDSNPDTLIYQLAEPITYDLNIQPLQCFENGTLYVEQTVRDSGIYSGGLSISNTDLPIDNLEAVYKVEGDTKTSVDISNCTVAADGLSFTIAGATDGEKYEYVYFYGQGTIPTIEYSVPLNRSAQIDGNTNMINQLSKELGDLWITLLPLADKELAMASIATITTDMSADVNDNELKNKINEILNVWV